MEKFVSKKWASACTYKEDAIKLLAFENPLIENVFDKALIMQKEVGYE